MYVLKSLSSPFLSWLALQHHHTLFHFLIFAAVQNLYLDFIHRLWREEIILAEKSNAFIYAHASN